MSRPTPTNIATGNNPPDLARALAALLSDRWMWMLIDAAIAEDMGRRGDITSQLTIPAEANATASLRPRRPGCVSGLPLLGPIAKRYDQRLSIRCEVEDGQRVTPGQTVAQIAGPMRSLLAAERVLLNFLTHLSGIATLTDQFVAAVANTNAQIVDTRKTLPAWRTLAKYAVLCGGGRSHRMGLYDAVLIKDNHLVHVAGADLGERIAGVVREARRLDPPPLFVEVEVDRLDQLEQVLGSGVDIVLLDNMDPPTLAEGVAMRDAAGAHVLLEASGGVDLTTVAAIAATGVDRIAIGALTHSAPTLDLGLDIAPGATV